MIVCKYKFDKSIYENLIPVFNDGYKGYTVSDVTEGSIVTRTIECNMLPTLMRFGVTPINNNENVTNRELSLLEILDINTNEITTGYCMFFKCNNLSSINTENFNTSNVTDMRNMFRNCINLTSLDLSNFNTSNVTNMSNMFYGCSKLTSLDVSNFNTSNVSRMDYMFRDCVKLTSLDVNNFDTSNVSKMDYMFYNCKSLTSLDVSKWDTKNVIDMNCMFAECISLTSLDVSNWNTSNVTIMYGMFYNCAKFTELDVSNFDISKAISMGSMFGVSSSQNSQLRILNINNINIDTSKSLDDRFMIYQLNLEKLYLNDLDTLNSILQFLSDRTGKEAGKLVTSLRNKIPEETLTTLTTKNWEIVDIVAQYRFDANTYENLIPEFNAEFSSDKYEMNDNVSEIVIDNIKWEDGKYINQENGLLYNYGNDSVHTSNFLNILENVEYKTNQRVSMFWYNENKTYIGYIKWVDENTRFIAPVNAKYVRMAQSKQNEGISITAKLITRSIESVNGDLPTLMRFGLNTNIAFDNCSNKELCLLRVNAINTKNLSTAEALFRQCRRMVYCNTTNMNTSNISSFASAFQSCANLTSLDVSNWDVSKVTSIGNIVQNCQSLTSLDVSKWDTSNVKSMYGAFQSCTNLTSLDVSNWNTTNVTYMQNMFYDCNKLTSLNVSNWDTNKVADMSYMFYKCNSLTSLDVSNWNTSNVTNMSNMFFSCHSLASLDVGNWDTSNVTSMNSMFSGCTNLTSLDVSNFNTSKVTDIAYMFSDCSILQTVGDLTNWDTKNLEFCHALFYRCFKLKHAHMSGWNTSKVGNVHSMFAGCESIEIIDMHNFDFKNAYNDTGELFRYDMFQLKYLRINDLLGNDYAIDMIPSRTGKEQGVLISDAEISEETLTKLKAKNWTVVTSDTLTKVAEYVYDSNTWRSMIPTFNDGFTKYFIDDVEDENGLVTRTISSMGELPTLMRFGKIEGETTTDNRTDSLLEILDMDTSELTSCHSMFRYNKNLTSINCEWDTSNITSTYSMFYSCYNLTSLDVSNFDTSNVGYMQSMFYSCYNLTSLDVSNFNTSKVASMKSMFNNCKSLTSLDVSNFNTSNVTNMGYMFTNCKSLTSLDVSNFNTSNVTNIDNIFNNTPLLTDIGMLYCTPSTINKIASNLPTTYTQTIWVKDTDINKLTPVNGIEFKEYKENGYMINLSSPLLNGDRIEVVDGKLCHYHKMGMVVLDGSENFTYLVGGTKSDTTAYFIRVAPVKKDMGISPKANAAISYCDTLKRTWIVGNQGNFSLGYYPVGKSESTSYSHIRIRLTLNDTSESVKQWLSENPTTIVYELANPYYEDITPIQSDIVLETYLESNLDIYTKLPIKANVSYITNVPSLSTLSMRATEMKESDNIIANLTNMLDNEINE